MRLCVHGAKCICVGALAVDDVWVVCVDVDELGLLCHQIYSIIFVRLSHRALGMFDFIF